MFIMVDGIDGSGKSTLINAWKEMLIAEGNGVFDLKKYWLETGRYPEPHELKGYDFIFTAEPSNVGVGQVIREELVRAGTNYPPEAVAEAYALDRLILYQKIIIPSLKEGRCIIQDRGYTTSYAYQPLSHQSITQKTLSRLPGNALAIKYRPDHIVFLNVDPQAALNRLLGRAEKKDNVIFEKLDFQTKAAKIFLSKKYQRWFAKQGVKIHQLSGNAKIDIIHTEGQRLLKSILNQ
ncbi:MAG: dTMP kinase [Candidatus Magasanikbacteria bacterium]|nr:dTMP kinase [Candidatus Magasanikbacteria bacterium]